ncbi:MAG TPA: hypothetical protein VK627_08640 [Edaphobacter sp.]|nr:hypothetical protein [Edaphobacter sp.]
MLTRLFRLLGLTLLLAPAALGQTPRNRTYVGQDVFVAAGQQVHNAICLFCSVQVEGDISGRVFVLFGSLNVSGRVDHDATIVGGNAVVDSQARIGGDTVVLGGNAVYETDESISGRAFVLGGHLSRTGGRNHAHKHVSISPAVFYSLAILAFLILSLLVSPQLRHRATVRETS